MDTKQCPHCGTENDVARALCVNCQTPLTAYAGQLNGERYQGNLSAQVAALSGRPIIVNAMAAFLIFVTIAWPARAIITAFAGRARLNEEGTNYLASAFGAIAPILMTLLCVPIAAFLLWMAWATLTQRPKAWVLSLISVGIFCSYILFRIGAYHSWAVLWLGVGGALAIFWVRPSTKAWFGLN